MNSWSEWRDGQRFYIGLQGLEVGSMLRASLPTRESLIQHVPPQHEKGIITHRTQSAKSRQMDGHNHASSLPRLRRPQATSSIDDSTNVARATATIMVRPLFSPNAYDRLERKESCWKSLHSGLALSFDKPRT
ncbi:hypothetical protein NUW54_g7389 [Trametes sanguinea]|uniref:Uncharacterized protein n=1 Tax=Trametes sanguinea TaxID=158606 RepID=A0ACC1PLX6_9APHY|nr:hypothetical protein NUW54_g7389 [Trametes sanguinea]